MKLFMIVPCIIPTFVAISAVVELANGLLDLLGRL